MPAIFALQCLALASSSRAWLAPTKSFLRVFVVNKRFLSFINKGQAYLTRFWVTKPT